MCSHPSVRFPLFPNFFLALHCTSGVVTDITYNAAPGVHPKLRLYSRIGIGLCHARVGASSCVTITDDRQVASDANHLEMSPAAMTHNEFIDLVPCPRT